MNHSTKLMAGTMLISMLFSGQVSAAQPATNVQAEKDLQLIEQKQADVTGDQTPDTIALYGKKMDKTSAYVSELLVKVTDGKSKQVISINLNDGGYEPKMSLQDFTADKAAEIMVTVDTGGSGGYTTNHIYSVKNGKAQSLGLPSLEPDKEGVVGAGFTGLKPVVLNKDSMYTLEGTERLIGEYNADLRGYLKSQWKWNQTKWELVSAAFEPTPKELPVYEKTFRSSDSSYSF